MYETGHTKSCEEEAGFIKRINNFLGPDNKLKHFVVNAMKKEV